MHSCRNLYVQSYIVASLAYKILPAIDYQWCHLVINTVLMNNVAGHVILISE